MDKPPWSRLWSIENDFYFIFVNKRKCYVSIYLFTFAICLVLSYLIQLSFLISGINLFRRPENVNSGKKSLSKHQNNKRHYKNVYIGKYLRSNLESWHIGGRVFIHSSVKQLITSEMFHTHTVMLIGIWSLQVSTIKL